MVLCSYLRIETWQELTFKFPKHLPKKWIEAIEQNGRVGSEVHGLKVVGKDKRGTIIHVGKDSFKILHNGKNQNVFGNPLVGNEGIDPNKTKSQDKIVRDKNGRFVKGFNTGYGFQKGYTPWNKGKAYGLQTRKKMSEAHLKNSLVESFNGEERDIIIGSLLGDGNIRKTRAKHVERYTFREGHATSQKEYLDWKAEKLKRFNPKVRINRNKGYVSYLLETSPNPLFAELYKNWYQNGHKVFSEKNIEDLGAFGLAVWYQDDGDLRKGCPRIATCCFSLEENKRIVDWLKRKFGLSATVQKDGKEYYRLRIRSMDKEKFFRLIVPFVHKTMQYKLPFDPSNFGYETKGAGYESINGRIKGSVFTITEDGTADSITAAIMVSPVGSKSKCAIYLHSDLSLIGSTEEKTSPADDWMTYNFITPKPSLIANTAYILVVWGAYANNWHNIRYSAGDTDQGHTQSITYNGFPNPLVPTHNNNKYSIYCTYTAAISPVTIQEYIKNFDLVTRRTSFRKSLQEYNRVFDVPFKSILIGLFTAQEFSKLWDAVTTVQTVVANIQTIQEYAKLFDRLTLFGVFRKELQEYSKIWDTITVKPSYARLLQEFTELWDTIVTRTSFIKSLNEYLQLWDVLTTISSKVSIQIIQDYIKLFDTITSHVSFRKDLQEYSKIWDTVITSEINIQLIQEFSNIFDLTTVRSQYVKNINEYGKIWDIVTFVGVFRKELSEYTKLWDIVTVKSAYMRSLQEFVRIWDVVTTSEINIQLIQEYQKLFDLTTIRILFIKSINEYKKLWDIITTKVSFIKSLSDYLKVWDAITVSEVNIQLIYEFSKTWDIATILEINIQVVQEYQKIWDILRVSGAFQKQLQEYNKIFDTITMRPMFTRTIQDFVSIFDSASMRAVFSKTVTDYVTLYDAVSAFVSVTNLISITDYATIYDSISKASIFTLSITEFSNIFDIVSVIEECLDLEYFTEHMDMLEDLLAGWSISKKLERDDP